MPLAVFVAPAAQVAELDEDLPLLFEPAVADVSWLELVALLALGSGVVEGVALGIGAALGEVALGGVGMVGVAALAGAPGVALGLGAAPGAAGAAPGVWATAAPERRRPALRAPARI